MKNVARITHTWATVRNRTGRCKRGHLHRLIHDDLISFTTPLQAKVFNRVAKPNKKGPIKANITKIERSTSLQHNAIL
ncbi:MAG: hypothetical protein QXE06_07985 [Candidatus Bathyarchaeia archaeon]